TEHAPGATSYAQRMGGGWLLHVRRHGVRCEWTDRGGVERARELVVESPVHPYCDPDLPEFEWEAGAGGGVERSPYRTGSVIAKLAELSQRVAASTMWPVELVPWFVLTGSPPSSHAILTSIVENAGPDSPAYQIR